MIVTSDLDDAMNLIKEELAADMTRLLIVHKEEANDSNDSAVYNL